MPNNNGAAYMHLCVYASEGAAVEVERTQVALNPVVVSVGNKWPNGRCNVYLGLPEAQRLHDLLGAALSDLARGEDDACDLARAADMGGEAGGA